jgi:hypothetical protein
MIVAFNSNLILNFVGLFFYFGLSYIFNFYRFSLFFVARWFHITSVCEKNFRFIMLKYTKTGIKEDFRILSMQHIIGISRQQLCFQAEDTISPNNQVRFIDAFVEYVDRSKLNFALKRSKTKTPLVILFKTLR